MKELIIKQKRLVICAVVGIGLGFFSSISSYIPKAGYNELSAQQENIDQQISEIDSQINSEKEEVEKLQAQRYEAEKLAKEEEERLAKEEADRIEAEKVQKEEVTSLEEENAQQETVDQVVENEIKVWVTSSGKKYHSNQTCSNMKSPS